jgi:hypothetical protein
MLAATAVAIGARFRVQIGAMLGDAFFRQAHRVAGLVLLVVGVVVVAAGLATAAAAPAVIAVVVLLYIAEVVAFATLELGLLRSACSRGASGVQKQPLQPGRKPAAQQAGIGSGMPLAEESAVVVSPLQLAKNRHAAAALGKSTRAMAAGTAKVRK